MKIRAVDPFSWSRVGRSKSARKVASVNGHMALPERVKHEHIDDLLGAVRLFIRCVLVAHWRKHADI